MPGGTGAYGWDAAQDATQKKKLSRRERRKLEKERERQAEAAWAQEEPYYDGYYDDVPPEDAGEDMEGFDWGLARRVLLLIALASLIVAGCAALMYLL